MNTTATYKAVDKPSAATLLTITTTAVTASVEVDPQCDRLRPSRLHAHKRVVRVAIKLLGDEFCAFTKESMETRTAQF